MVLNTIRILLGKKIINPKEDDKIFKLLKSDTSGKEPKIS